MLTKTVQLRGVKSCIQDSGNVYFDGLDIRADCVMENSSFHYKIILQN